MKMMKQARAIGYEIRFGSGGEEEQEEGEEEGERQGGREIGGVGSGA